VSNNTEHSMNAADRELVERFLHHLKLERRLSDNTVKGYRRDLDCLLQYCEQQHLHKWQDLQHFHIRQFAATSFAGGLSSRSIQRRLSGVRSLLNYLIRENHITTNPANDVKAPKGPKRLPETLDADQMARLLDIKGKTPADQRDRAMLELMYSSGLRLAELTGLNLGDVDLADATVKVLGKGNKERIVPVGRHAAKAVSQWLKVRSQMAAPEEQALFIGQRGSRISHRSVQLRVKHWGRRAGLPQRIYPHLFRHSFATHILESSSDLRGVQELLGHVNIGTTQVYTHLDFQHLAQIYDKAHPRARARKRDN
jgi:integrase/recombinase XerC